MDKICEVCSCALPAYASYTMEEFPKAWKEANFLCGVLGLDLPESDEPLERVLRRVRAKLESMTDG